MLLKWSRYECQSILQNVFSKRKERVSLKVSLVGTDDGRFNQVLMLCHAIGFVVMYLFRGHLPIEGGGGNICKYNWIPTKVVNCLWIIIVAKTILLWYPYNNTLLQWKGNGWFRGFVCVCDRFLFPVPVRNSRTRKRSSNWGKNSVSVTSVIWIVNHMEGNWKNNLFFN